MKSKTLTTGALIFKAKAESDCSEARIKELARETARALRPSDRVFFEGPMGSGKSTFIRFLLEGLRIAGQPQGSPTFSIAHEYLSAVGRVIHIDLFRLESLEEVEMSGLLEHFQENPEGPIVLVEWGSRIPELMSPSESIRKGLIRLEFGSQAHVRTIEFL